MYLTIIMFLSVIIPVIIMPRKIVLRAESPYKIVLHASLFSSAAALLVFIFASTTETSIYEQIYQITEAAVNTLLQDQTALELLGMQELGADEQQDMLMKLYMSFFDGLPIAIMIFNVIAAYFEYMIMSKLMSRRISHIKLIPPLREFNLPPGAVWGVMLMYLAAFLLTHAEIMPNDLLYVNMSGIFDFVLTLQGMSVVLMLFHMKRLPKVLGYVVVIFIWGISIGRWLLVFIGMFDIILGLKVRMQNSTPRR